MLAQPSHPAREWPLLGADSLDGIAGLVQRSMPEPPTSDELRRALFAPEQPAVVRGDPAVGVVATVRATDDRTAGFVRLLAVDPESRRRGVGASLLGAAERDLNDVRTITIGADAPFHLFAGVPIAATAMLCLLERSRYHRVETNFDMVIDLDGLGDEPVGVATASAADRDDIDTGLAAEYPNWALEFRRALDQGTLVVSRDESGAIRAACAYEVNRAGTVGPVASRLDLIGTGAGRPVLLGALHRMRAAGATSAQVAWVGPIRPYAEVGGTVSRIWFVYRKPIGPR